MRVEQEAPAKINLSLRVFERMANGYHRIETVMVKLALGDRLVVEVDPTSQPQEVEVVVPGYPELESPRNLVVQAAQAYLKEARLARQIRIEIHKRTPLAAGLGGGSSDAATTLRALNEMLRALAPGQLVKLGAGLGADIPFFLHDAQIGVGSGMGDEITPWPTLSAKPVVLIKPPFPISTPEAYRALGRPLTWPEADDKSTALRDVPKNWSDLHWLFQVGNDLEGVMMKRHPEIGRLKEKLLAADAELAQMSGSGPTVFGLFSDKRRAAEVAERLGPVGSIFTTTTAT